MNQRTKISERNHYSNKQEATKVIEIEEIEPSRAKLTRQKLLENRNEVENHYKNIEAIRS